MGHKSHMKLLPALLASSVGIAIGAVIMLSPEVRAVGAYAALGLLSKDPRKLEERFLIGVPQELRGALEWEVS